MPGFCEHSGVGALVFTLVWQTLLPMELALLSQGNKTFLRRKNMFVVPRRKDLMKAVMNGELM